MTDATQLKYWIVNYNTTLYEGMETYTDDDILDTSTLRLSGDFDKQVDDLLLRVRLSRQQVEQLVVLYKDLEQTIGSRWPGSRVFPFGSIVTGLGIQTSDVDIYIALPPHVRGTYQNKKHDPVVHIAKSVLSSNPRFTQLFAIGMAKVPIVKCFHIPTQRHCDINFKSPSGVENTNLIAFLLNSDPRALQLAIIIKYWSKVHNLTGTNLMSNYGLTMLVIFYLQQRKLLPPVLDLQMFVEPHFIDNWNTTVNEDFSFMSTCTDWLYDLLGGFFQFYNEFDFEKCIVCPYLGYPIPKRTFSNTDNLPAGYGLYKQNLELRKYLPLRINTTMCIQDPFEHCRNCAVAVFPKLFNKLQMLFQHDTKMFKKVPRERFLKEILRTLPDWDHVVAPPVNRGPNKVQKKPKSKFVRNTMKKGLLQAFQEYTRKKK